MQYNGYCVNFFFVLSRGFSLTKNRNFTLLFIMSTRLHMSSIFDDVIKRLNTTYSTVRSNPLPVTNKPLSGYVHTLEQGNAIFITDDRRPYLITLEFAVYYQLKTGDRLQARVAYDMEYDNYLVNEVVEVQHVAYDEAPMIKADRSFTLFGTTVNFGTSVLLPVGDNADIVAKVPQIMQALPDNVTPVFLSFDGRPTNFDVPTAYFTKPNYTSREKLMACLLAFFHAKQQADNGQDVVLIIDSLDKMFFAFNNCMQSAGMIDPNAYSCAAVMDYENILCSSGKLKAGGSLTIIGLHHAGTSPQLQQVNDRLPQILDAVIN